MRQDRRNTTIAPGGTLEMYGMTMDTPITHGRRTPTIDFWFFVPKSGVAFIFISVAFISIWNNHRETLEHPYLWIFSAEILLFFICFYVADNESATKRKKLQPTNGDGRES